MHRKIILFCLISFGGISSLLSQLIIAPTQLNSSSQKLLLELSSNYVTVVKENQVDLDSSLLYVSNKFKLSRLRIATEGINDSDFIKQSIWFDQRNVNFAEKQLSILKGKKYAEQLIIIGAYYAFEPASNQNANTLGLQYLNKAINISVYRNQNNLIPVARRLIGKIFLKEMNLSSADSIFETVIKFYRDQNDKYNQAKTFQWWALYSPVTSKNTIDRINNASKAVKLFGTIGDNEEEINAMINRSYLYLLNYEIDSAYTTGLTADSLCEKIKFPYKHYIDGALSVVTMFQGKFGEPIEYAVEAAKNAETLKDSISLPYLYGILGSLYATDESKQETAIAWNMKSINCFLIQKEPCYLTMSNNVSALIGEQRNQEALKLIQEVYKKTPPKLPTDFLFYYLSLANYYLDTSSWQTATNYLKKADDIESGLERHGMDIRKATILFVYANLYLGQNKYEKAESFFRQFLEQKSNVGGTIDSKATAWRKLIFIDSALGAKDQQLSDYRHYTNAMADYNNVSKTRLEEELQVKYSTEAKENQIRLLTQKSQLENNKEKHAELIKNITIAGIVMLLIIAVLLFRQNVIRQRSNKIISDKNKLLQDLVAEKEWLVKEIHHRVKNNLHTIICLLESQATYLDNDALAAVQKSQHRIYAMSLIHQKLYQSDDLKVISMKVYIIEFIQYLVESYGAPENVKVITDVDDISLGVAQAIPLGLIINEAVSNSFKYAFPNNRKGEISILLNGIEQRLFLTIADDGIGSPKKPGDNLNSLGLELINGLAIDLRANIIFENNSGTIIKLDFLIDPISSTVETSGSFLKTTV